jgi:hypothetical protein
MTSTPARADFLVAFATHRRRRIDAEHRACRSHSLLGSDRERARPAADVENGVASVETGQPDHLLAQAPFSASRE